MNSNYKELEIPVPWGRIAGKLWGNPSGRKMLAIHGKQDNCGVFDRLIPLLQGDYYVLAIDLPGHGFSSHYPRGIPPLFLYNVLAVASVIQHLEWKRFLLLGHSFGGQIGFFFTASFPECIEKFIVIDHISPANPPGVLFPRVLKSWSDNFLAMSERLKNGKSPVYSYNDALEKLMNRDSSLTTEAAHVVLKRSLKKVENGYNFVMDQRIKLNSGPTLNQNHMKEIICSIECPILAIFSSERYGVYQETFKDEFEWLRQKRNFSEKVVAGNHDVHQNHPERIVDLVDEFSTSQTCKL